MKARPILFSSPMVRALLDGRKTQTRRFVKPPSKWGAQFPICAPDLMAAAHEVWWHGEETECVGVAMSCPYGVPGDLLWVKETLTVRNGVGPDEPKLVPMYATDWEGFDKPDRDWDWTSSRYMPRWASRMTLEITGVRVERLQAIDEPDAREEGAAECANGWWFDQSPALSGSDARGAYYCLWEHINGSGSWAANPWVWVVEFKVHRANVDQVLAERRAA